MTSNFALILTGLALGFILGFAIQAFMVLRELDGEVKRAREEFDRSQAFHETRMAMARRDARLAEARAQEGSWVQPELWEEAVSAQPTTTTERNPS